MPLFEAVRRCNVPALDAFLAHFGGGEGFVEALVADPPAARGVLKSMAGLALTHPPMVQVFFDLWSNLRARGQPPLQESRSAMAWPWGSLGGLTSLPSAVLERIHAYSPIPTPQSAGRAVWSAWVVEMCQNFNSPVLLKYALGKTPDEWWVMKPEGLPPHLMDSTGTLLGVVAGLSAPPALSAGVQAVSRLPQGWNHPDAPDANRLWVAAASSTACLRVLEKHLPPRPSPEALDKALLEVLDSDYDPSKRAATVRYLIAQGASASAANAEGNTALHLVSQWKPEALRHRLAIEEMLLGAGATWASPANHLGQTPFDVLRAHHALESSRRISERMESALPNPVGSPAPGRSPRL